MVVKWKNIHRTDGEEKENSPTHQIVILQEMDDQKINLFIEDVIMKSHHVSGGFLPRFLLDCNLQLWKMEL